MESYTPAASGEYLVNVAYGNTWAPLSTGITGAVKWVEIVNAATEEPVAAGVVQMPQRVDASLGEPSYLPASLEAGAAYGITMRDYFDMGYLDFFESYRGRGVAEAWPRSPSTAPISPRCR